MKYIDPHYLKSTEVIKCRSDLWLFVEFRAEGDHLIFTLVGLLGRRRHCGLLHVAQTLLHGGQGIVTLSIVGSTIADEGLQLVEGLLRIVEL